ncbi:MAG: 3-deoxy-7-phosphoheptulonate synthase [Bacteroidetes bacterium]|nr:MAG: 3-deoxy-7-phosphoheptulonate synthase [Bacteroidota bacterium]
MIIELRKSLTKEQITHLAENYNAFVVQDEHRTLLVNSSSVKAINPADEEMIAASWSFDNDMQLSSRKFRPSTRNVNIGNFSTGKRESILITGPCSVESEEQIEQTAQLLKANGLSALRAGSFKPRTSPYSFQGMGLEGLKLLDKIRQKYGFSIVTEVRDSTHVEEVIAYADVVQIGAKAMYDQGILRTCGKIQKPILLKRGFGTTLQEFVQAAEFILSGGNPNVILCERGIRTFETKSRFTLDLCGVAYLKEHTNLPIILDPSHAMGYAYGVPHLARACMAMDVDGLLIEVHPNPPAAKSDASQQLNHTQLQELLQSLRPIAAAVGRNIV